MLAVQSSDHVLSLMAALGLAASAGTCMVIDLVGDLSLPGRRSLADIREDGPRLQELSPGRSGVAVLPAGPLAIEEVVEVVDELASRWPAVAMRAPGHRWPGPTVPVVPLYPGLLSTAGASVAVWQPAGAYDAPGPGPVLPRLRPSLVRSLLSGRLPPRSRWLAAWRPVWGLPWA